MARIITVDDQASVRTSIRDLLESQGHTVVEACDGRDLMRKLTADFDLVISDMLMPEADGLEVIRHVKHIHPHIPVLVITGGWQSNHVDLLRVARAGGADQALSKSEVDKTLLGAVSDLLTCRSASAR